MKANKLDHYENGAPKWKSVETTVENLEEVDLSVEELEGGNRSRGGSETTTRRWSKAGDKTQSGQPS